ncbi:sensory histidine kinase DcuS [Sporanaerobacter sp. PP17-6a]|nr:sensory histidine kinase DcuS [Sporanaerobacter sp. PP17-6a]
MWIAKLINSLAGFISLNTSLSCGFLFVEKNTKDNIKKITCFSFILYVLYYISSVFLYYNNIIILIMLVLSIPVLKKILQSTYLQTAAGILISSVLNLSVLCLLSLIYSISRYIGIEAVNHLFLNIICILIYILINYFIYRKDEESLESLFIDPDNNRISQYGLTIVILLICILIWLYFVLTDFNLYLIKSQVIIVTFTYIFIAFFMYYIKRIYIYQMKQIEIFTDKQYQKEMTNFMEMIRSQRHDFNFHIQAISGMLRNEKYNECREYVDTMVKSTQSVNEVLPIYHPAVSAFLSNFREILLRKGIELKIQIYYDLKNTSCTVYEINKILGNLIQNAVDEVEDSKNRPWIEVMFFKRGGNRL